LKLILEPKRLILELGRNQKLTLELWVLTMEVWRCTLKPWRLTPEL
jgi:hypothetical protein